VSPRILLGISLVAAVAAFGLRPTADAQDTTATTVTAVVDHWSDGDTVVTDLGKIRLIGINAPDIGECGYGKATKLAEKLAPAGSTVTLTDPESVRDTDDYGRLLRYVDVGGVDVGLKQIKKGSQAPIKGNRSDEWIYHLPSNH
jgi:micrococcal nuclease